MSLTLALKTTEKKSPVTYLQLWTKGLEGKHIPQRIFLTCSSKGHCLRKFKNISFTHVSDGLVKNR